jgi:TetR/AcrR family transcriptional regulator, regulator of autoinduction and epiphytic fitness
MTGEEGLCGRAGGSIFGSTANSMAIRAMRAAQVQPRKRKNQPLLSSGERIREAAKRLFAERGYEGTSTAEICRLAGTSESQLVKHFRDKQGLLDAVFQHAWEQINPTVRLATEAVGDPRQKLTILAQIMMNMLTKDRELGAVFLLEGRRIRSGGHSVVLVSGYLEFVKLLDEILNELAASGGLVEGIQPTAMRSGLMGAIEGMLRDQLLSRTSDFPVAYTDADIRSVFYAFLSACLAK